MTAQRDIAAEPYYRQPPHNIEAEQALLGAILVNNDAHDRIAGFLETRHFYDELHGSIYETAVKLLAAGKRADPVTLKPYFMGFEPIDAKTTVPQYLGRLAANAVTTINAREYALTIIDLAKRRELISISEDVINAAYDSPVDFPVRKQIEELEARLYSLAESDKYGQGFTGFDQTSARALAVADSARKRDGGMSGVATRFAAIDAKLGGLQASDLVILAGRPSMGKTSLSTNIAFNMARAHRDSKGERGAIVGFFSLEMSDEQLSMRILAERAGIPSEKIRRGSITEDEWKRLVSTQQELATIPLLIDQTGGLSIAQLSARARRLKRQKGLGLVVVDYLQLMVGTRRGDNRVQEISEITNGLKALAKELHVPILALSQLSRAVENREEKRPQLSDLRESGSIEQDADVVMFVYREDYYLERLMPKEGTAEFVDWQADMQAAAGKVEVIISKQRHGPIGIIPMQFDGSLTRFSDLALGGQEHRQPAQIFK